MRSDWLERWHANILFAELATAGLIGGSLMGCKPLQILGVIELMVAILLPPERS